MKRKHFILLILTLLIHFFFLVPVESESGFTVVVLPDTQNYSTSYPNIFDSQTNWILDQKDELNIKFVVHVGDIVNHGGGYWVYEYEWEYANYSMSVLDGAVPYLLVPGNHDYENECASSPKDASSFNTYFPYSRFEGYEWYGGHYPSEGNENNYGFFSSYNQEFLVVGLEFCPTDEILEWADNLISAHSDKKVILFTHLYMDYDNTRLSPGCSDYGCCLTGCNDGEDIWNELVSNHSNIILVLSGHTYLTGRRTDYVDNQPIHQIMQNYQFLDNGGNGWLRYYTFKPDEKKIEAITYSPYLDLYDNSSDNRFDLDYFMMDADKDGIADSEDNCPRTYNPDQEDSYPPGGNNCGDACECEGDFDRDGSLFGYNDISLFKTDMGRFGGYLPCSICITGSSILYPAINACQTDADCGPGGVCGPDPLDPCYGDFDCDGDVKDGDISVFKADMGRFPMVNPCPPCSGVTCSY